MTRRKNPAISARKAPRQTRSNQLVAAILQAAVRVLEREGAMRFTTARVAETAGVSVGSLYQYFPNKEAILFRLQTDEWQQTGALLDRILSDERQSTADRLRTAVREFFRTECEEAALRAALSDAAPMYRNAPETEEHHREGAQRIASFVKELLPETSSAQRKMAVDVLMTTISAVGKTISTQQRPRSEVNALANAVSDMLIAYFTQLRARAK